MFFVTERYGKVNMIIGEQLINGVLAQTKAFPRLRMIYFLKTFGISDQSSKLSFAGGQVPKWFIVQGPGYGKERCGNVVIDTMWNGEMLIGL